MNEFLTTLAKRIERFTGCVDVKCVITDGGTTLNIQSANGVCHIVLRRHRQVLYEVYGRWSQGGIDLMERIKIRDLLVDSEQ